MSEYASNINMNMSEYVGTWCSFSFKIIETSYLKEENECFFILIFSFFVMIFLIFLWYI